MANATKPKGDSGDTPLNEVILAYYHGHAIKTRANLRIKSQLSHILPFFEGVSVVDGCKPDNIERFTQKMLGMGLKSSYINNILTIVKAAVNRAYKRGELTHAPFVGMLKQAQGEPKGRPLSVDEIATLFLTASPHVKTMIMLGIGTGARPEAICDLTWAQIDFDIGVIDLNPQGRVQTGKYRPVVKLPPSLADWLCTLSRPCDAVVQFRGRSTHRYHNAWQLSKKRAGLSGVVSPYSLRHSVARWLRSKGVPAWETAAQLGHPAGPRLSITERYTSHSPDYLVNACAALDELVSLVLRRAAILDIQRKQKDAA